jgi:hypothetical protein
MKVIAVAFVLFLSAAAQAEVLQIRQTIFGMD